MPSACPPSTLPNPGRGDRRPVTLSALAATVFLGASACGASGSTSGTPGSPATNTTASTAMPSSETRATSSPTSTPPTSTNTDASATTPPAGAGGLPKDQSVCALIDLGTATTLLGSKPTTLKVPDTSDDMVTHVDRCNWSAAESSLAYQVNRYANPAMAATIVRGITGHLPPAAQAVDFPPSGKGFVVAIGAKAMGRAIVPLTSGVVLDLTTTAATSAKAEALLHQLADTLTRDIGG